MITSQPQGYFTTQSVRLNPPQDQHFIARTDSVPSNIDVVGLHPKLAGTSRTVSRKSWQGGFATSHILSSRAAWRTIPGVYERVAAQGDIDADARPNAYRPILRASTRHAQRFADRHIGGYLIASSPSRPITMRDRRWDKGFPCRPCVPRRPC
jgi:hypothetical protein